ncbi:MAG TPA: response regulator [Acidimicrobiales bacterium]|nr:response regulator [Acidimicrobiales bacterium]
MNFEPISVLIVDDDETVGRLLARCCDGPDFKVIDVVADRASALAAVADHAPDVVLIDQRLGRDSGVAVAGELLARAPSAKVIVITGDPHPDLERAAAAAGCWAVVGKTLTIAQDLPDLVRRAAAR